MEHFIFQPVDEDNCMAVSYDGRNKAVIIPHTYKGMKVVKLCDGLFAGHSEITGILLPPELKYIGSKVFSGCISLKNLRLPKNLEYAGEYAFAGSGLEIIEIPGSITEISSYAFKDCMSLNFAVIRKGVKKIKSFAFDGCSALALVAVPSDTEISHDAFNNCSMLNPDLTKQFTSTCKCPACTGALKIRKPDGRTEAMPEAMP